MKNKIIYILSLMILSLTTFAAANNMQQSLYNGILITGANAGTVTLQFSSAIGGQTGWFRTDSVLTVTKK